MYVPKEKTQKTLTWYTAREKCAEKAEFKIKDG